MSFPGASVFADKPVFASFLFDASGSMEPYTESVIRGHAKMLDTLRKSEVCSNGVLFVQQGLFADKMKLLNKPETLSPKGSDNVKILDGATYQPGGMTALYDSLLELLTELMTVMQRVIDEFAVAPTARVAIITDGQDNVSKNKSQQEVWKLIEEMRKKEWLYQSIVIGLQNTDFDQARLDHLKKALNFQTSILLDQDERSIRRAFQLASKLKGPIE